MTSEQHKKITSTAKHIMVMLVAGEYSALEAYSNGVRLSASDMRGEIENYGRTLILPPDSAYEQIDVVPITAAETEHPEFSVRLRFYTNEEGESDLELQATFIDSSRDMLMGVEVDGILVA